MPYWPHNHDTVQTRTVNAAWDALFTIDLTELSFASLAKGIGVSAPALYHHFPSLSALGEELAIRAGEALHRAITNEGDVGSRTPKPLKELVTDYVEFANKRKRHFTLAFSPQFAELDAFPEVHRHHLDIASTIFDLMTEELKYEPEAELHAFWSIIHGSAALVASGHEPKPELLLKACKAYLKSLK